MNEIEARAILGISSTATLSEARKAHRDLAKVFHPDRHASGSSEELKRATEAMTRINLAFETLEKLSDQGRLGRDESEQTAWNSTQAEAQWRPARANECFMCGYGPATPATFQGYSGFLFWFTSQKFTGSFCRSCGLMLFRETQAINLTRGWWGIVIFPMVYVAVANVFNLWRIRRLPSPMKRDINVVTPMPFPAPHVRPVLARPMVWIASGLAIFILVIWVGSSLQSGSTSGGSTRSNSGTPVPIPAITTPDTEESLRWILDQRKYEVGSCWSEPDAAGLIGPVGCLESSALFEVSQVVLDELDCPIDSQATVRTDDGLLACLRLLQ